MTPYYYRPFATPNGIMFKCAGICTEENAQWFPEYCAKNEDIYLPGFYLPGFIVKNEYMGEKIKA